MLDSSRTIQTTDTPVKLIKDNIFFRITNMRLLVKDNFQIV